MTADKNSEPQVSVLDVLVRTPLYAFEYIVGFILGALSDLTLTSAALTSVFLGFATSNAYAGLALFFGIATVLRIVNAINGAVVGHGRTVASAAFGVARALIPPSSPEPPQPEGAKTETTPEG